MAPLEQAEIEARVAKHRAAGTTPSKNDILSVMSGMCSPFLLFFLLLKLVLWMLVVLAVLTTPALAQPLESGALLPCAARLRCSPPVARVELRGRDDLLPLSETARRE